MLKAENIEKTKSNLTKIGEGAFGEVFKYTKNGSDHILKVSLSLDFWNIMGDNQPSISLMMGMFLQINLLLGYPCWWRYQN